MPPALRANVDEFELAATAGAILIVTRLAAFFCAFCRDRTFCLYAFANSNADAPDEFLSRAVVDVAGFAELLPRDGAEASLDDDAASASKS